MRITEVLGMIVFLRTHMERGDLETQMLPQLRHSGKAVQRLSKLAPHDSRAVYTLGGHFTAEPLHQEN